MVPEDGLFQRIKLKSTKFGRQNLSPFTCWASKEKFSPSLFHMKNGADGAFERLLAFLPC